MGRSILEPSIFRPSGTRFRTLGLSRDRAGEGRPVATSFIIGSVFDRWRDRHPEWQMVARADSLQGAAPMIRVPSVHVEGAELGPVWFTRRPDANFTEYMSRWMDRPVVGALGGSAFRHATVVISYPDAVAIFHLPDRER